MHVWCMYDTYTWCVYVMHACVMHDACMWCTYEVCVDYALDMAWRMHDVRMMHAWHTFIRHIFMMHVRDVHDACMWCTYKVCMDYAFVHDMAWHMHDVRMMHAWHTFIRSIFVMHVSDVHDACMWCMYEVCIRRSCAWYGISNEFKQFTENFRSASEVVSTITRFRGVGLVDRILCWDLAVPFMAMRARSRRSGRWSRRCMARRW
jgi:hypothetical protein